MSIFKADLLQDQVALVTGGGSGIGRGIARGLAAHGAKVAICGRRQEKLDAVVGEITGDGGAALGVSCDVRQPDQVGHVLEVLEEKWGRLDILVNSAAGNFLAPAATLSPNGFGSVVDIDLKGTFNVSKAAYPLLAKAGGNIVNITATLQYSGTPMQSHAASAKAGIDALTRCLAVEWAGVGIRVNGVAPGPIEGTPGMDKLAGAPDFQASVAKRIPLGRFGTIEEIADSVLFIISPASAYTTGAILVVDGGQWLAIAGFAGMFG